MKARLATVLAGAALLAACGNTPALPPPATPPVPAPRPARLPDASASTAPARETPDAPFRDQMPKPEGEVTFEPPKIESFALKNGVRVLFVERHELPVVSVELVVKGGAGDWGERPGVSSFMGSMLEQGTKQRSALQISDEYEEIGAEHGAWVGWDDGGVRVKVLSKHVDRALALLADVAENPAFPDAEIDRLRARRLAAIQMEKNSPGAMASNALSAAVYGRAHPYGNALGGREVDLKKITRDELVRAYKKEFSAKNAMLLVAGDLTREAAATKLEAAFGGWKAEGGAPPPVPRAAATKAKRLVVVDRPNAPQSQVLVAETGIPMKAPDRDAVSVMNAILGGVFSSRINMNLREAHAYTYGAKSRFSLRRGAGPFSAGGAIFADKTAPAIVELFKEIEGITKGDVTPEELADAKEHIKLALPGRFETVSDVVGALEDIAVYDLPLDEYATLTKRIDAVTAADVKKVAQAHLHPGALRVIVVGDRKKIATGLEGLNLGAPEFRDAYGDMVP